MLWVLAKFRHCNSICRYLNIRSTGDRAETQFVLMPNNVFPSFGYLLECFAIVAVIIIIIIHTVFARETQTVNQSIIINWTMLLAKWCVAS